MSRRQTSAIHQEVRNLFVSSGNNKNRCTLCGKIIVSTFTHNLKRHIFACHKDEAAKLKFKIGIFLENESEAPPTKKKIKKISIVMNKKIYLEACTKLVTMRNNMPYSLFSCRGFEQITKPIQEALNIQELDLETKTSNKEDENNEIEFDSNTKNVMDIKEELPEDIIDYDDSAESEEHSVFKNLQESQFSQSFAHPKKTFTGNEPEDITEDLFYFGRYIAAQLRRMPTFNAVKCQKTINDIIENELLSLINAKSNVVQFEQVIEQPNIPATLKTAIIPSKSGSLVQQSTTAPNSLSIISTVPSTSNSWQISAEPNMRPPSLIPVEIQTVPSLSTANMADSLEFQPNLTSTSQQLLQEQFNQLSAPFTLPPEQYYTVVNPDQISTMSDSTTLTPSKIKPSSLPVLNQSVTIVSTSSVLSPPSISKPAFSAEPASTQSLTQSAAQKRKKFIKQEPLSNT